MKPTGGSLIAIKRIAKSICSEAVWERLRQLRWQIWDVWHDVETCGSAELSSLTVVGDTRAHAVRYEASGSVSRVLDSLDIQYNRYSFIDFGSGKGRVLLLASEFPFISVEGVEFSRELHAIASRNILRYRRGHIRCRAVKSVLMNATEYELPPLPVVLYFFNPFTGPVLSCVVAKIRHSLAVHSRDALIISAGRWTLKGLFEETLELEVVCQTGDITVYRCLSQERGRYDKWEDSGFELQDR